MNKIIIKEDELMKDQKSEIRAILTDMEINAGLIDKLRRDRGNMTSQEGVLALRLRSAIEHYLNYLKEVKE